MKFLTQRAKTKTAQHFFLINYPRLRLHDVHIFPPCLFLQPPHLPTSVTQNQVTGAVHLPSHSQNKTQYFRLGSDGCDSN